MEDKVHPAQEPVNGESRADDTRNVELPGVAHGVAHNDDVTNDQEPNQRQDIPRDVAEQRPVGLRALALR